MNWSYGTNNPSSNVYPSAQTPQQPQYGGAFNPNRQESQGSYFKDSPKRSIFGGAKGGTGSFYDDNYISGASLQRQSPPRTLASNFQTKPSNIADFDHGTALPPEKKSPARSVTPNYITRPSNLAASEYQIRPSAQEPIFANPIFSRDPSGVADLEMKKNLSQKAFSGTLTEHAGEVKSQHGSANQGVPPSRVFGLSQVPSSTGPLMRPSTVVQMDPLAKVTNPTRKMPYFSDKRVVITGASSGIGRAIAMWFLNSGARVALIGRDLESLINVGKQFPNQALVIKCDLSKDDQPYDTYSTILAEFHGIDILINAAGVMREGDIKNMLPQDFDNTMDVNLRAMFYLSYLFFPELQKSRGSIINLSCQYGTKPFAGLYAYCMSKAGVETLTKHLAHEFATSGVRVNAVSPGLVETNLLAYRKLPQGEISDIYSNTANFTPLKRIASIDDVGKAIVFLCSEAAAHITGQILKIDGGRHLTSSGWHQWEGQKAMSLMMESKESIFTTLKGKILQHSTTVMGYNEKDKIGFQTKQSSWSTADHQAHAAIKCAKYHEQDIRHDPRVSVMAMENTFQNIFTNK